MYTGSARRTILELRTTTNRSHAETAGDAENPENASLRSRPRASKTGIFLKVN